MSETAQVPDSEEIVRASTAEEIELAEWADETYRKSLAVVTDDLKQLVTLSTALLGGTVALYNQMPVPAFFKAAFFLLVLGTLGLSLLGSYPITATVLHDQDIKAARDRGISRRSNFLLWANFLLFAAFASLALNLLLAAVLS